MYNASAYICPVAGHFPESTGQVPPFGWTVEMVMCILLTRCIVVITER